eukprot:TRINITY_DN989_c0_g2_i1.p1 TRINITY_DN989_c0_g2~~TRINITY_DN989_c0_g2_i1.p1  ORF type:complete len:424 (-),score=69.87 TRINITY_DN989_c0_g2_i1:11-1282(-)
MALRFKHLQLAVIAYCFAYVAKATVPEQCVKIFKDSENSCKTCEKSVTVTGDFMPDGDESWLLESTTSLTSLSECCAKCRSTSYCEFFSFGPSIDDDWSDKGDAEDDGSPDDSTDEEDILSEDGSEDDDDPYGTRKAMVCKLFTGDACTGTKKIDHTQGSFKTGGNCNPEIKDDPHFIGAHGVKYDFNGVPGKTFCLVTDAQFHINVRLSGYYASTPSASSTIRSWIKEIIIFWHAAGKSYTLQMIARPGKETARGPDGFVQSIIFNGKTLPKFGLRDRFVDEQSGLYLELKEFENLGAFEVDAYHLYIKGLINAEVRARVAHPKLQLPDDAETHLNLKIRKIDLSRDVHGVLGQTYRDDRAQLTEKFRKVVEKQHAPIKADGSDGQGFLDGVVEDYETLGALSTACKFDRFVKTAATVESDN